MSDPRLTPGDPLGGPAEEPTRAPQRPPQPDAAPERPADAARGYGAGPVPPGVLRPRITAAPAPLVLAEWWRRALAALVDGLVVGAAAIAVLLLFGAVFSIGFFGGETAGTLSVIAGLLLGFVVALGIALVYAPLLMSVTNGRTLGKIATGCRVVRTDGRRVDFWWAAWREVAIKGLLFGVVGSAFFSIPTILDALWPLWDDENRALHDMLVGSRVVRG